MGSARHPLYRRHTNINLALDLTSSVKSCPGHKNRRAAYHTHATISAVRHALPSAQKRCCLQIHAKTNYMQAYMNKKPSQEFIQLIYGNMLRRTQIHRFSEYVKQNVYQPRSNDHCQYRNHHTDDDCTHRQTVSNPTSDRAEGCALFCCMLLLTTNPFA